MSYIIHPYNSERTINWASGTSTELFIHPSDGNFQTRQFVFRISTATVEADETNFSDFTGLTRILMVLRGKLTLIHEGRYEKVLEPYQQDTFDGGWKTRSKGRVQDFNVMCNSTCEARVTHKPCRQGDMIQSEASGKWLFLFIHDGTFACEDQRLKSGDLIEYVSSDRPSLSCIEDGNCIEITVY
ncbi:MAG: HutD family protein [Flavobacteriales bacterium]|nr:HutD family protein [Flavobacteriales bacterium]